VPSPPCNISTAQRWISRSPARRASRLLQYSSSSRFSNATALHAAPHGPSARHTQQLLCGTQRLPSGPRYAPSANSISERLLRTQRLQSAAVPRPKYGKSQPHAILIQCKNPQQGFQFIDGHSVPGQRTGLFQSRSLIGGRA